MEVTEDLLTKGVDHILSELPSLMKEKKIGKDDLQLILLYAIVEKSRNINTKLDEVKKEIATIQTDIREMHKDLRERLDLIIDQMRLLNSNIAAFNNLLSKAIEADP